jgi:hypothetical protein
MKSDEARIAQSRASLKTAQSALSSAFMVKNAF